MSSCARMNILTQHRSEEQETSGEQLSHLERPLNSDKDSSPQNGNCSNVSNSASQNGSSACQIDVWNNLDEIETFENQQLQSVREYFTMPKVLWGIVYLDFLLVVYYITAIYRLRTLSTDMRVIVILICLCALGAVWQLLMGSCLLAGLNRGVNVNVFLWYCKAWSYFQLSLLLVSPFTVVGCIHYYATSTSSNLQNPFFFLFNILIFLYRLLSYILVSQFIWNLKDNVDTSRNIL